MDERTTNELLGVLKSCTTISGLEEVLVELPESDRLSVREHLHKLLKEKGLDKAAVIREANLARTYGYQIFQGEKTAGRDKLLAIAFAMNLSLEECNRLLTVAKTGVLYSRNRRDAIIIFSLERSLSLLEVNELLYEMEESIIE